MSEVLAATPGSNAESGGASRTPATKDRSCPFCHAPFTSSSLGRHLDLYIKEKNPKPPDEVHDVEEIRRLRGNVTRRQPRTLSTKREDSAHSSSKPTSMREQRSPSVTAFYTSAVQANGGSTKSPFGRENREAAGVVNDPSRLNGAGPPLNIIKRRNNMRNPSLKEEFIRKQDALEEKDRGRAAELALIEVLESVKAANLRTHPRTPLDFNWFSQSFPAICLRCLSAPTLLLSTPPIPGRPSWPIEPPGAVHLRHLEVWLRSRLDRWKQRQRRLGGDGHYKRNGTNGSAVSHQPTHGTDGEEEYIKHLSIAYQNWESLSDEQKQENWRLECQKALTQEQEAHLSTITRLNVVEQELHHLRARLDQRRNCQQPIEFSQFPPSTMPLSHEALDELDKGGEMSNWDYESAILKWKTRIRNERNVQQPLPSAPISIVPWTPPVEKPVTNGVPSVAQPRRGDQRVHHNNGPDTEHEPPDEDDEDDDEDLVDAPGDDDDEESVPCHPITNNSLQHRVLDPDLGDPLDTVMKDTNSNMREAVGEGFSGGRMLMDLRTYGNVMGNDGNL